MTWPALNPSSLPTDIAWLTTESILLDSAYTAEMSKIQSLSSAAATTPTSPTVPTPASVTPAGVTPAPTVHNAGVRQALPGKVAAVFGPVVVAVGVFLRL